MLLTASITGSILGPVPAAGASTTSEAQPFGRFGAPLDVDHYNSAAMQLAANRASMRPAVASALEVIARYPSANWYGSNTPEFVQTLVHNRVEDAAKDGAIAQLVVFNLPHRGCEGAAEPGPTTAAGYKVWFRGFLRGLGTRRAIVIVEPDALALASCLSARLRTERYGLIRWAVNRLERQGSWAYIDIGHSKWLTLDQAAARLQKSGIADAAGFSLNESNFRPDGELLKYGRAISRRVGGRHFVIDSSRNGVAPKAADTAFCNPPHKGLGHAPTGRTGIAGLDAFLWIKNPGGSDGTCNGGPDAGHWYERYALMLVRNAHLT
ncbi:glycoside hydrolase family 6 protein [uncultured Amnibacterium sp.]|uniref:glycoside hydrolase family 6 protein n=1 Tax=uncultured Amnibacterium sp. TaxID=1631851 RepID=UPI0035CA4EF3